MIMSSPLRRFAVDARDVIGGVDGRRGRVSGSRRDRSYDLRSADRSRRVSRDGAGGMGHAGAARVCALVTGIVMSFGMSWGLFRHYWVVAKLTITVFSTLILLVYMRTFEQMAAIAADPSTGLEAVRNPSPVLHAVLAIVLLFVATVLGIYKPRGLTAYGQRVQRKGDDV